MIQSPNFGADMPAPVVDDLLNLHNDNEEIDKQIIAIVDQLPKLE